jgi:hypothetical protein
MILQRGGDCCPLFLFVGGAKTLKQALKGIKHINGYSYTQAKY